MVSKALIWTVLASLVLVAASLAIRQVCSARGRSRSTMRANADFHMNYKSGDVHVAVIRYGDARLNQARMRSEGFRPEERDGVHLWVKTGKRDTTDRTSMELVAYVPSQEDFLVACVYEKFRCVTLSPREFVAPLEMPLSAKVWASGSEAVCATVVDNTVRLFRVLFEKGYVPPDDPLREDAKTLLLSPFLGGCEELVLPEPEPSSSSPLAR